MPVLAPARTPISWTAPVGMTFEAWQEQLVGLLTVHEATPWLIGDCLNAGEAKFGEDYAQAIPDGYAPRTLANYKWVANRVPVTRRRERLSFGHHAELAALEADEQQRWLDRAEQEGLSRNALRLALKGREAGRMTFGGSGARAVEGEILAPLAANGHGAAPRLERATEQDALETLKCAWEAADGKQRSDFLHWIHDEMNAWLKGESPIAPGEPANATQPKGH